MTSLFTDMAGAVIDELEPHERTLVDPKVFTRIIGICAEIAEARLPDATDTMPAPPAMHFINAGLLIVGDCVWRDDLSFECVVSVAQEQDEVVVVLCSDRTMVRSHKDPIRVAVNRFHAQRWNEERAHMDEGTVRSLYSTYGAF